VRGVFERVKALIPASDGAKQEWHPSSIRAVEFLAPLRDTGQTFHRDPSLPGFGCVVGRSARTWTYQLDVKTLAAWRTVRKAVGRVEQKSYKDARREAELALAELREARLYPWLRRRTRGLDGVFFWITRSRAARPYDTSLTAI
jgi:hypothetical protein